MVEARLEDLGGERRVAVVLGRAERALLRSLPSDLRELLDDPARSPRVIDRLFPAAHDDPADEAEHRRLLGRTMWERRREALQAFEATLASSPGELLLTEAEADLWLYVLNDFRLVLGTELDIRDNDWSSRGVDDPEDEPRLAMLLALTAIQDTLLDALRSG